MSDLDWNDEGITRVYLRPPGRARCDGVRPSPALTRTLVMACADPPAIEDLPPTLRRPPLVVAAQDAEPATLRRPAVAPDGNESSAQWPVTIDDPNDAPSSAAGRAWWLVVIALVAGTTWLLMHRAGTLHVELAEQGEIPDAEVLVDGVRRCQTTPCVVHDLVAGEHSVRVLAGTRASAPIPALVTAWREGRVVISMPNEPPARVLVAGAHSGVLVHVDGASEGLALPCDLQLDAGEHVLRFSAGSRYRSEQRRVLVRAGELLDLGRVGLRLEKGRLDLELATEHAQLWLRAQDGTSRQLTGPFPMALELAAGDYEVVASRRGFRSVVRPIRVDAASPEQRLRIELRPLDWAREDVWEL